MQNHKTFKSTSNSSLKPQASSDESYHVSSSQSSNIGAFDPTIELFTSAFETLNLKFQMITNRLLPIEARINGINESACLAGDQETVKENQKKELADDDEYIQLTKREYDNLLSRITVLETQCLLNRNVSVPNAKSEIDKTIDESQFHSILNFSNQYEDGCDEDNTEINNSVIEQELTHGYGQMICINQESTSRNRGAVCQGEPVDFDRARIDSQTPTRDSKLAQHSIQTTSNTSSDLSRAKELVLR